MGASMKVWGQPCTSCTFKFDKDTDGSIFAITGRIWMLMAAPAFGLTALAMIYWKLEARVAHLIFSRLELSSSRRDTECGGLR
jgi:hypothetical protein